MQNIAKWTLGVSLATAWSLQLWNVQPVKYYLLHVSHRIRQPLTTSNINKYSCSMTPWLSAWIWKVVNSMLLLFSSILVCCCWSNFTAITLHYLQHVTPISLSDYLVQLHIVILTAIKLSLKQEWCYISKFSALLKI